MDLSKIEDKLRSFHFRQEFFILAAIALVLLYIIRYLLTPRNDKPYTRNRRGVIQFINALIAIVFCSVVLAAFLFWIIGNP